ncbi:MAG: glycosyltransferase [Rubrivivax sp.]|nr:MAG: glycosyltransferase [Rubrivivax sp.]
MVPAFNEEGAIATTVQTIAAWLGAHVPHWEITVIDDGSSDRTADVVLGLEPALNTSLIRLSRNFGKEAALTAGLDRAKGGVLIGMDADGQHPVELLGQMLAHWCDGVDMVYTVRQDREHEPGFKRFGARWFYRVLSMGEQFDIPEDAGDFRLMDRRVIEALKALPERNRFMKGLYAWVGFRTLGLPYTPLPREHGNTTYSKRKLVKLAWMGLTGFSSIPLRVSSAVGLVLALVALAYGLDVIEDHFLHAKTVPGWPTIVASIMFFSGVQLLFIGILGEYLARVYDEVKGRPTYLVADVHDGQSLRRGKG